MAQGQHFLGTAEQHIVLTHNAAATHRADTQLLRAALLAHLRAVVDILIAVASLGVDGIGDHQGRAAGGIQFIVMVLFDDLNVKLAAQDLRSLAGQLDQHIDAQRHVGAAEDGRFGAGILQHGLVLGGKAGGADHAGHAMDGTILYRRHRTGGGRKVDDGIDLGQALKPGINGDIADLTSLTVHTGHHAAILAGCNFFDQRMAHAAVDSLYHNIRHFLFPFKKGPQQVATGRSA